MVVSTTYATIKNPDWLIAWLIQGICKTRSALYGWASRAASFRKHQHPFCNVTWKPLSIDRETNKYECTVDQELTSNVLGGLAGSRQTRRWNYAMSVILNIMTLTSYQKSDFTLGTILSNFACPDPIWNGGALGFFGERHHNKINKKTSSRWVAMRDQFLIQISPTHSAARQERRSLIAQCTRHGTDKGLK